MLFVSLWFLHRCYCNSIVGLVPDAEFIQTPNRPKMLRQIRTLELWTKVQPNQQAKFCSHNYG
jgi:hypothetical protein